jgi:acyl-CoA reductase-like NAD-dependent aldehyde dehydrogenase
MDAAGLVARDPDDGRVVLVVPTARRTKMQVEDAHGAVRYAVADWSPSERSQFAGLLARFNEALLAPRDEI